MLLVKPLIHLTTQLANVPKELYELKAFISWTPQLNQQQTKWLKKPIQKTNEPTQHKTLIQILDDYPRAGLVFNLMHNYIALDIDNISLDNLMLSSFLAKHPTYIEESPSGGSNNRFRALYKLPHITDKHNLASRKAINLDNGEIELYNSSENYNTITGQALTAHPYYSADIAIITAKELTTHFPDFIPKPKNNIIEFPEKPQMPVQTASLTNPELWLETVSCDREHPLVKAFCQVQGWVYYEYWLYGLMAIHAAWGPAAFGVADTWSMGSTDYNRDEVLAKWTSFTDTPKPSHIGPGTYELFFRYFTLDWPVKNKNGAPLHDEISNFEAYLDHLNLSINVDSITQTIFLDGPESMLYPYFYDTPEFMYSIRDTDIDRLASLLGSHMRLYKFRPKIHTVRQHIMDIAARIPPHRMVNRFARQIDTYTWDTVDRIRIIAEQILQRNTQFKHPDARYHELFIRKWLYSLARYFWPNDMNPAHLNATAEGMLVLSGQEEGIGKSSFGVRLFPKEWAHLHIQSKPRFSGYSEDKDYKMKTCTRIIVDFDEAERIYHNNEEADLKAYQTASYDIFRVPYGTAPKAVKRQHSLLASTNEETLTIPREGARRCWWLNVRYVDTYAMDKMDRWQLWAQIKIELLAKSRESIQAPWVLNQAEKEYLLSYLSPHRTSNSLEDMIHETFATEPEGYMKKIIMTKEYNIAAKEATLTKKDIAIKLGVQMNKALSRALDNISKQCAPKEIVLGRTVIREGKYPIGTQIRYFMPVERSEFI